MPERLDEATLEEARRRLARVAGAFDSRELDRRPYRSVAAWCMGRATETITPE